MTLLAGKVRQRAWKPKNRTGCKTCKIRKVKCDEEKPFCKRCTSTGRTCDGYDVNFRPQTNTSRVHCHLSPGKELARSLSPVPLAPALRLNTAREQASFEFFTTHAVSSLRGFMDSPFWQRELLQAAHQHESIQHCIVALGAMHRRFYEGHSSHLKETEVVDESLQFALQQSNQAIQGLVRSTGPKGRLAAMDKVTLMTCSILFSSMACLQGHQREGLQHLRSGIRLLNELDQEEDEGSGRHPVDIDSLRSIIVGLDMQARAIMTTEDARSWEPPPRVKDRIIALNANLDDNLLVAMHCHLQASINQVLTFLPKNLTRPREERDAIALEYRSLFARFDHTTELLGNLCTKAAKSKHGNTFTQSIMALKLLHAQLEYFLRVPRADLEAKFHFSREPFKEPFDIAAHFARMLDMAILLLSHDPSLSPVFTTSMGPSAALWLIACRAPSECIALRKRAVRAMLSYPRREGFWDGLVAGQIAQELLRLEQESTFEELGVVSASGRDLIVPDDLRIVVIAVRYHQVDDRKATITFRTARDIATDAPGRMHYLSW
ncbi:hypothetical protein ACEQ8H_008466 [Pleosporales sp. CAS-2024a]